MNDGISMRMQPADRGFQRHPAALHPAPARRLSLALPFLAAAFLLLPSGTPHGRASGKNAIDKPPAQARQDEASGRASVEQARIRFLARYARLEAEINGQDAIVFPPELVSRLADPAVAAVVHDEKKAFETTTKAFREQMGAFERDLRVARIELKFAQEKHAALDSYIDSLRDAIDVHDKLAAKGQALAPERLNLQQRILDYRLMRTDVDLLVAKTQEDIDDIERGVASATNQYRATILSEFNELRPVDAKPDDRAAAHAGAKDQTIN